MSLEYHRELEAEIDQELKGLPELEAPSTLITRVHAVIRGSVLPWYRQSWASWSWPLQAVSFAFLAAIFGGLCFGSWKLSQTESVHALLEQPMRWLSTAGMLGHAMNLVFSSLVLAAKGLSTGLLLTVLAGLAFGYIMCFGLGTVYFRLALARR